MILESVRTRFEETEGFPVAIIGFDERLDVLSSCLLNGGAAETSTMAIIQVPPGYDSEPVGDAKRILDTLELPDDTVCFMTAAEIRHVLTVVRDDRYGFDCMAIVTAGLSNQVVAGEEMTDWEDRMRISEERRSALTRKAGTINIIGIVSRPLTDSAKVNSLISMTEAKTAALNDLGYKETGTTSDAIAIVCPKEGRTESYAGTGYGFGLSLARAVRSSVRKALIKRDDFPIDMEDGKKEDLRRRYL